MRFLAAIAFGLLGYTCPSLAADRTFVSPRGAFTITQHYDDKWTTKLHFTAPGHADVTLTGDYPWPAIFHVSPDDQWILQVQKSGSGDNISFLYRLDTNGRLWRMEQPFGDLGFTFLEQSLHVSVADLYHTGIEFTGWNLQAGFLSFTIRGSSTKKSGDGITRELVYDLQKHIFQTP